MNNFSNKESIIERLKILEQKRDYEEAYIANPEHSKQKEPNTRLLEKLDSEIQSLKNQLKQNGGK